MESATSAVSKYDKARLTGQLVRVLPYVRGFYPRDVLYSCWAAMEQEGLASKVFHSSYWNPDCEVDTRGDLVEFVQYFSASSRLLQICQAIETQELAGLIWFEDIIPHTRASCGIFFRRKYWGGVAKEASLIARDYAFWALDVPTLYSFTPWPEAKRHAQQVGFEMMATLPDFVQRDGHALPINILCARREDHHG